MNLKRVSDDFEAVYGHPIFLAETFVDESRYKGTCYHYQASNWHHIGYTRGYSKCNKRYYANGQIKAVYIYPLQKKARAFLCGDFMAYKYTSNFNFSNSPIRRLMYKMVSNNKLKFPIESLIEEIRTITDSRKLRGIRHPLETVLGISVCAVMFGCRSYDAIADWADGLPKGHRERFGSRRDKPPSEPTFRRILQSINAEEFDQKIGQWLLRQKIPTSPKINTNTNTSTSTGMSKGMAVAIDGKALRGSRHRKGNGEGENDGYNKAIHLLSAVIHKEGVVIAQQQVGEKTNEIKFVKPLLKDIPLEGAVITADALHTQKETAKYIVKEKNADY